MVVSTEVTSCELDYVVRGCHIYTNWEPFIRETLACAKKNSNPHDLYSVAVFHRKEGIFGHLPRAVSRVCSSFVDNSIPIVQCPSPRPPPSKK